MILYVDTALSGVWYYRQGKGGPPIPLARQPHLVRLSWVLEGPEGQGVREASHLVKLPDGAAMDQKAGFALNIFSHMLVAPMASGLQSVITEFADALGESSRIVAYNWQHHRMVLEASFSRCGRPVPDWPAPACAMIEMAPLAKIPRQQPGGGWKWPSWDEAYESFFIKRWHVSTHPLADGLGRVQAVRNFHHAATLTEQTRQVEHECHHEAEHQ